ncbi:MAG TPA: hypothetical protein VD913_04600, partial [bacterium]|nr:hypothetical protein [bacterium]
TATKEEEAALERENEAYKQRTLELENRLNQVRNAGAEKSQKGKRSEIRAEAEDVHGSWEEELEAYTSEHENLTKSYELIREARIGTELTTTALAIHKLRKVIEGDYDAHIRELEEAAGSGSQEKIDRVLVGSQEHAEKIFNTVQKEVAGILKVNRWLKKDHKDLNILLKVFFNSARGKQSRIKDLRDQLNGIPAPVRSDQESPVPAEPNGELKAPAEAANEVKTPAEPANEAKASTEPSDEVAAKKARLQKSLKKIAPGKKSSVSATLKRNKEVMKTANEVSKKLRRRERLKNLAWVIGFHMAIGLLLGKFLMAPLLPKKNQTYEMTPPAQPAAVVAPVETPAQKERQEEKRQLEVMRKAAEAQKIKRDEERKGLEKEIVGFKEKIDVLNRQIQEFKNQRAVIDPQMEKLAKDFTPLNEKIKTIEAKIEANQKSVERMKFSSAWHKGVAEGKNRWGYVPYIVVQGRSPYGIATRQGPGPDVYLSAEKNKAAVDRGWLNAKWTDDKPKGWLEQKREETLAHAQSFLDKIPALENENLSLEQELAKLRPVSDPIEREFAEKHRDLLGINADIDGREREIIRIQEEIKIKEARIRELSLRSEVRSEEEDEDLFNFNYVDLKKTSLFADAPESIPSHANKTMLAKVTADEIVRSGKPVTEVLPPEQEAPREQPAQEEEEVNEQPVPGPEETEPASLEETQQPEAAQPEAQASPFDFIQTDDGEVDAAGEETDSEDLEDIFATPSLEKFLSRKTKSGKISGWLDWIFPSTSGKATVQKKQTKKKTVPKKPSKHSRHDQEAADEGFTYTPKTFLISVMVTAIGIYIGNEFGTKADNPPAPAVYTAPSPEKLVPDQKTTQPQIPVKTVPPAEIVDPTKAIPAPPQGAPAKDAQEVRDKAAPQAQPVPTVLPEKAIWQLNENVQGIREGLKKAQNEIAQNPVLAQRALDILKNNPESARLTPEDIKIFLDHKDDGIFRSIISFAGLKGIKLGTKYVAGIYTRLNQPIAVSELKAYLRSNNLAQIEIALFVAQAKGNLGLTYEDFQFIFETRPPDRILTAYAFNALSKQNIRLPYSRVKYYLSQRSLSWTAIEYLMSQQIPIPLSELKALGFTVPQGKTSMAELAPLELVRLANDIPRVLPVKTDRANEAGILKDGQIEFEEPPALWDRIMASVLIDKVKRRAQEGELPAEDLGAIRMPLFHLFQRYTEYLGTLNGDEQLEFAKRAASYLLAERERRKNDVILSRDRNVVIAS